MSLNANCLLFFMGFPRGSLDTATMRRGSFDITFSYHGTGVSCLLIFVTSFFIREEKIQIGYLVDIDVTEQQTSLIRKYRY